MLKLLVIGSGGREHAICKKLLEDPKVDTVFCAPGNPGMKKDQIQTVPIPENNHEDLITFAKEKQIAWTFIGPEAPLAQGIVDAFSKNNLKAFGPSQAASKIEGSKEFAKELMKKNNIPTADYETFTDIFKAKDYVLKKGVPIVIKADGLAQGKGVVVAQTEKEAFAALEDMLENNKFGQSGARVIVEEFLPGEEFSLLAFVQGEKVYPMVISQDHKRVFEGDKGPNTGGMGAYSPVPQISPEIIRLGVEKILKPAASGMVKNGTPFTGILYAGVITDFKKVKVIEFNARFGDPETQVILPRLKSSLADIITDLLENKEPEITWKKEASFGVVVCAKGYPGPYEKGMRLPDFSSNKENIYYAGVKEEDKQLKASGGRVFLVQSCGKNLKEAKDKVYESLENLSLDKMFYRKDIGYKAF